MAPEPAKRLERSVDMLKELYTVVVALALVEAVGGLLSKSETSGLAIHLDRFQWFVAVFLTLLPFYHGALMYLDAAYIFAPVKPKRLALLVDYLILFCEACLLVALGLLISRPQSFVRYYMLLLSVDVVWILLGYFLTPDGIKTSWRWLVINAVSLVLVGIIEKTPMLDSFKPNYIIYLAMLRTAVDYVWCWRIYVPDQSAQNVIPRD